MKDTCPEDIKNVDEACKECLQADMVKKHDDEELKDRKCGSNQSKPC